MGNVFSIASARAAPTTQHSESETMNDAGGTSEEKQEDIDNDPNDNSDMDSRTKAKEEAMTEFRKQLNVKREQRKEILTRHRSEKEELEKSLANERKHNLELFEKNKVLRDLLNRNNIEVPEELQPSKADSDITNAISNMRQEVDNLKQHNIKLRKDIVIAHCSLHRANSDIADLTTQNTESMKQISALKEVITCSKTLIGLREQQLNELKKKLDEIEHSLADREANMLSDDLRKEYERQLQNIRTLRGLYEERARLAEVTKQGLLRELEEQKSFHQIEVNKCNEFRNKIDELESQISDLKETIEDKNEQIKVCKEESRGINAEMSAVNKLFSQVLLGYKTEKDLDKLGQRLEENHGLLTQLAEKENDYESSSALPKLLLEIVSQVDEKDQKSDENNKNQSNAVVENISADSEPVEGPYPAAATTEDIVQNLPKVWRVLMELLSHQTVGDVDNVDKVTTCYKSVETKSGPVLVPSVSQTYIRLKDLIVEKLSLIKEVNRMKQLNTHLECRLGEQERRLCLVTTELSKTWHVVGRLRRHHHQLHTHEKILKYELQQKRKLLNELKEELEYCREKWEQAREKNTQSEKDWKKLRAEFSSRKSKPVASLNNSAESGYSDEKPSDDSSESNDESEHVNQPLVKCKKKMKKSFETIIDSSTDLNVAEREDPVSDMIDVADLPLDTQESEENQELSLSEGCTSENLKNEKICNETEDEAADIINECVEDNQNETGVLYHIDGGSRSGETISKSTDESLIKLKEDMSASENSTNAIFSVNDFSQSGLAKSDDNTIQGEESFINPKSILESICKENESLAEKNNRLNTFEDGFSKVNESTSSALNTHNQIDDQIKSIPSSSKSNINFAASCSQQDAQHENKMTHIDPKAIMTSIRRQNERLAKRDERLKLLEEGCDEVVKSITKTLTKSDDIKQKLEIIHSGANECIALNNEEQDDPTPSSSTREIESRLAASDTQLHSEANECVDGISLSTEEQDDPEPSSSTSEIDHEARFAARDIRLKRLEEQTKSLVKRVNKTTSKGVKIHYKLEELHNIYGSEGSRAGTPSEENGDTTESIDDDDEDDSSLSK